MKKIIVNKNDIGQRLDTFLNKMYPGISKVVFLKWIRKKDITINQKRCVHNQRLLLNDSIEIYYDNHLKINNNWQPNSNYQKLDIVFEDDNLMIVYKPVGMLTHDESNNQNTLINNVRSCLALNNKWDYKNENCFKPSLVHRIDRNTAGLVVIAKNQLALKELNNIFKTHQLQKKYYALVHGEVEFDKSNEIKVYIDDSSDIVKIYHDYHLNTKVAISRFQTKWINKNTTLLDVEIQTGRKHQIRATLNMLGFPIVGDRKYCKKTIKNDKFKNQCLVAYSLKFKINDVDHPLAYLNKKKFELSKIWFLEK